MPIDGLIILDETGLVDYLASYYLPLPDFP